MRAGRGRLLLLHDRDGYGRSGLTSNHPASRLLAAARRPGTGWLWAFTATLFLSAALLFAVQPMVAKMVLPLLGGAPATWITAMLFFQAALLAGYAYAHWSTRWLGPRRQPVVHLVLVALSLLTLPVAVPAGWEPGRGDDPVPWLLVLLVVSVGLPFFVASSTAPLLQRWFTATSHASAEDPYFLYRASNLGSLLALLAYPAVIEPRLRLADQGRLWSLAYGSLAVLTAVCAASSRRGPRQEEAPVPAPEPAPPLTAARRAWWVALAFVPSSFMLAVTTHITTDIAAVPLLWVIPLALYLLSFVVAFSPRPSLWSTLMRQAQPFLILELVLLFVLQVTQPALLVAGVDLLAMFASALVCHARLAEDRPPSGQLTEFYLWVALGGALGGLFNAVVAPVVFDTVAEYPLAVVLACLVRPRRPSAAGGPSRRRSDLLLPLAVGVAFLALEALGRAVGWSPVVARAVALVVAVGLCAVTSGRPVPFGLSVGALLVAAALPLGQVNDILHRERTFFGVLKVDRDPERRRHRLVHGNTVHGAQSAEPEHRLKPLLYYGPVGQVLATLPAASAVARVAVIGLGTGSTACYGRPEQRWTFYEIDPAVERVARDPRLFTYLRDCPPRSEVVLGDARLSLAEARRGQFGVIVLDAFNSDAIPVHLLTREAVALYVDRLADGGVIALHITNRYLDLRGVVGDLAGDAGLAALVREGLRVTPADAEAGSVGSVWVVLARSREDLAPLASHPTWTALPDPPGSRVWTDDFSNLLGTFKRG